MLIKPTIHPQVQTRSSKTAGNLLRCKKMFMVSDKCNFQYVSAILHHFVNVLTLRKQSPKYLHRFIPGRPKLPGNFRGQESLHGFGRKFQIYQYSHRVISGTSVTFKTAEELSGRNLCPSWLQKKVIFRSDFTHHTFLLNSPACDWQVCSKIFFGSQVFWMDYPRFFFDKFTFAYLSNVDFQKLHKNVLSSTVTNFVLFCWDKSRFFNVEEVMW